MSLRIEGNHGNSPVTQLPIEAPAQGAVSAVVTAALSDSSAVVLPASGNPLTLDQFPALQDQMLKTVRQQTASMQKEVRYSSAYSILEAILRGDEEATHALLDNYVGGALD